VIVPSAPRKPNFAAEKVACFAAAIADSRNDRSPFVLNAEYTRPALSIFTRTVTVVGPFTASDDTSASGRTTAFPANSLPTTGMPFRVFVVTSAAGELFGRGFLNK